MLASSAGRIIAVSGKTRRSGRIAFDDPHLDPARPTQFDPLGRFAQIGAPVLVRAVGRAHDVDAQQRLWKIAEDLCGISYPSARDPS